MHEMEHPAIPFVFWLGQGENVEPLRGIVVGQFRCHGISDEKIQIGIPIKIGQGSRHADRVFIEACRPGGIDKIRMPPRASHVLEKADFSPSRC